MITGPFTASPRFFAVAGIAFAAALTCVPASAQRAGTDTEVYAPGRILLMPRAGLNDSALARILKEQGGGKARRVGQSDLRIVDLPAGLERAMVQRLARHPHIKFAELDRLELPNGTTNDPYLGSQWHLAKIGAGVAWDQAQGTGLTIAVLDTGVDASHADLSPRLVAGWNFFNNTADTSDAYNHGTGVAGSAAAAMNNGIGVAGVSGQTKVMPIRISDASGYGSWSAMAQGLTYAADRGVRVANISFSSAATSSSVLSAAQYMKGKNGLVFVSSGNTGAASTASPTTSMIVVGATDSNDARRSSSTYGPVVSLTAPGSGIYTTTKGGGYVSENGTSFAAPVAAGVAALVMSANPSLSSAQVESILFSTAVDLGTAGRDDYFGHGRVDAAAAVAKALATTGVAPSDTQAPAASITDPLASATVSGLVPVSLTASDNVGVTKVELRVNGNTVATDTVAPFAFSWDSATVANGSASLSVVAYDAAGNAGASATVGVNVANNVVVDTTAPVVSILSPTQGAVIPAAKVTVSAAATDDSGAAQLTQTLYINGKRVASATGGSLSYVWNATKIKAGSYTLRVDAVDTAGNKGSSSVTVRR
jgi:subtilisin family serine protease